jgi:hypothetical protein
MSFSYDLILVIVAYRVALGGDLGGIVVRCEELGGHGSCVDGSADCVWVWGPGSCVALPYCLGKGAAP